MYMSTIGSAIMESLAAFEAAVKQALHFDGHSTDAAAAPLLDAINIIREAGGTYILPPPPPPQDGVQRSCFMPAVAGSL